jgi:ABC-type dipeptide/oligopeptide/nickel transport system permease subunit
LGKNVDDLLVDKIEGIMTIPAIIFGIILSTAYGTGYHLLKGGKLHRIFLFIILAWLGFWLGQFAGDKLGWTFAAVGPLNVGAATLGSVIILVIGEWLSRVEITSQQG